MTNEEAITDASDSVGYWVILKIHWLYGSCPLHTTDTNITYKELFPITLAVEILGCQLANQCLVLHSDNEAVVHIIQKAVFNGCPNHVLSTASGRCLYETQCTGTF